MSDTLRAGFAALGLTSAPAAANHADLLREMAQVAMLARHADVLRGFSQSAAGLPENARITLREERGDYEDLYHLRATVEPPGAAVDLLHMLGLGSAEIDELETAGTLPEPDIVGGLCHLDLSAIYGEQRGCSIRDCFDALEVDGQLDGCGEFSFTRAEAMAIWPRVDARLNACFGGEPRRETLGGQA